MKALPWQQVSWKLFNRRTLSLFALLLGVMLTFSLTQSNLLAGAAQAQTMSVQQEGAMVTGNGLELNLASSLLKPGEQSAVMATLRNSAGQPIAGELVVFFGGLGTVSPASAVTDAQGRVSATYTAGSRGGHTRVTVLAGYSSHSAPLQVEGTGGGQDRGHQVYLPAVAR